MRTLVLILLATMSLCGVALADAMILRQFRTDTIVERPDGTQVPLWYIHWQYGMEYTYYLDAKGREVLHGRVVRHVEGSRAMDVTTYRDGVRHGPFTTVGPDGDLESRGAYRDEVLDGDVTYFYRSGAVKRVVHYDAGTLEGPYRKLYEDGTPREVGRFVAGQKAGPVTGYHANGAVAYVGTFRDGYLSGPFREFDEQGRKRAEGTLDREWIVGGWHCFAPDGTETLVRADCDRAYYTRCSCP